MRKNENLSLEQLAKRTYKKGNVWFIKNVVNLETAKWLVSMRDLVGAKLVMDFDDNFFKIPDLNAAFFHFNKERIGVLASLAEKCDWITVSTEPLKEQLKGLNKKIVVLPNLIDEKEWKFKRKKHKKIRIGWIYNTMHLPDAEIVGKVLHTIKKKYKDKVELVLFGGKGNPFTFDVTHIEPVEHKNFPKKLCELGLDISIAPVKDNDYNKAKSNIKWMESTMSGAAFVGSKLEPYLGIKNGKTGFLAKNEKEWIKYISMLVEDRKLRKELVKNAKKEVLNNYSLKKDEQWRGFFKSL